LPGQKGNTGYKEAMRGYRADLAYIHDVGYSDFALNAAPGLLHILRAKGVEGGRIIDLGCGTGRWALKLNQAGYKVFGIDQSTAMVKLARRTAPESKFRIASFFGFELPPCDAITSIGECLNYCFDESNTRTGLFALFKRAHFALRKGGVFIFDVATPARLPKDASRLRSREGHDWVVISTTTRHRTRRNILCRRVTYFRRHGNGYRRSEEIHCLRLYRVPEVVRSLVRCGFDVRTLKGYGQFRLPVGMTGFLAMKR
jgi:SAM-dependent methyltransferase